MEKKLKSIFCNQNIKLLLVITLFGTFLRLINIDKPSGMWYDELWTYNMAKQSFPSEILSYIYYYDTHPPLYYFIVHFWMKLFGETDYMLRLLSVIFGALTIPIIYLAGKELKSKNTGLIAALLLSINSLMIYFSQEIRSYSLLTLLCTLSIYFLIKIKNNPNKWNFAGLALTNTAILYTHFLGGIFIFFEACIMLVYLFYKNKKSIKPLILVQIITLLLFCPYIPSFIHQYDLAERCYFIYYRFNFWKLIFMLHDWFSPIMLNIYYPPPDFYINLISSKIVPKAARLYYCPFSHFVTFAIVPVAIYLYAINKAIKSKKFILAIFLIGIFYFLFEVYSAIKGESNFETRFTTFILPIFILTASCGFSELKNKILRIFLVSSLVILSVFYIISDPLSAPKIERTGGCKSIVSITNKYSFDNDDLVIIDGHNKDVLKKYYFENKKEPQIVRLDYYFFLEKILDPQKKYNGDFMLSHELFKNFLLSDQIHKTVEDYFNNAQKKLKIGSYLAITYSGTPLKKDRCIKRIVRSDKLYNNTSTFELYPSKIFNSFNKLAGQNLKLVSVNRQNGWVVYIYKKIR